ncbi:MAG: CarD family transcriptional regulator [Eubacterium sp.]|nr:CarD family transcriptional regulator [Candidatus Colimonas fimequi]
MTRNKYEIGDLVVYGTNGLCTIEGVEMMSFGAGLPENPYYVLRPDSNSESTVYVPINNEKLVGKLRKLLTEDEINEAIAYCKDTEFVWDNDRRYRNERFRQILAGGVHRDVLCMIRCIYERKHALAIDGKKLPTTDNNILKQAEKLVNEEFSYVLKITPNEVGEYIKSRLEID